MAYVAADYWQIEYTEGELIVLAALPSAIATGNGLTYSSLSMSADSAALSTSIPLLTASMPIFGSGAAESLSSAGIRVSTAIDSNSFATATGAGLTYSQLTMSASGYAVSSSASNVTSNVPIAGQAYSSSRVVVEYADAEYWLDGYSEAYPGSAVKVSTAVASMATANASGQANAYSRMAMSADGHSAAVSLSNVVMAMPVLGNAHSQSVSNGIIFSTVSVMGLPKASAMAKCRMIKFVGYEFPIGTFTLNSVTPIHSLYTLTDIYSISSLTPLYDMSSVTPQHSIVSIS